MLMGVQNGEINSSMLIKIETNTWRAIRSKYKTVATTQKHKFETEKRKAK